MPLLTNFVSASDLEARAAEFTRRFGPTAGLAPCIGTLAEEFGSMALDTFGEANHNFGEIFENLELLEAWAWKTQAEKDPAQRWLPHNGKATAEEFERFLAEKEWGSPPQYAALENLLGREGKALYAKFEGDRREEVPRWFFLHRCARLHYGV